MKLRLEGELYRRRAIERYSDHLNLEAVYEVTEDGEQPMRMSAPEIASEWDESVPDFVQRVLQLSAGTKATLFDSPRVDVQRIL